MKTLNVQKIDRSEFILKWGIVGKFLPYGELFIRSNNKGEINFDKAPVYTWDEIQAEKANGRPVHFTLPPNIDSLGTVTLANEKIQNLKQANKELMEALTRISNCNDLSTAIEYAKDKLNKS